jgi:hypothetical protein
MNSQETNEAPYFAETELSFKSLKDNFDISNTWIRKPKNILMIHETIKSVGYNKILNHLNWEQRGSLQINNSRSLKVLIDSLALTFDSQNPPQFYREFWQRRKKEGNSYIVHKVLTEIKAIAAGEIQDPIIAPQYLNDTLKHLTEFEILDSLSSTEVNSYLRYIISIGLHQSAWNVRSGDNYKFDNIIWETEPHVIYEQLKISEGYTHPWIIDNTK